MTLPIGLSVRNFLFTGVLEKVAASGDVKVVAFTPIPNMAERFPDAGENLIFEPLPVVRRYTVTGVINRMLNLRFQKINNDPTLTWNKEKRTHMRTHMPKQYLIDSILSQPLTKSEMVYKGLNALHNFRFHVPRAVRTLFDRYEPSMVFATNPNSMQEYYFLKYAKLTGGATAGMIHSWDTLTTEGRIVAPLDYCFVWNGVMQKELIDLHHFPEDQIKVTGIPQFDVYADPVPDSRRNEFLLEQGLDPQKQTVLFATSPGLLWFDAPNVLKRLADTLGSEFGGKLQILVRLHQQDSIDRFSSITHPSIKFQIAGSQVENLGDNRLMDQVGLRLLRDSIACTDVVINAGSTMTIDAASLDKPVVNVDFDLVELSYYRSVRILYDVLHFTRVVESGASRLARSFEEMVTFIKRYLTNPELEREQRANLTETMCYKVDGRSAERIAGHLLEALDNHQSLQA